MADESEVQADDVAARYDALAVASAILTMASRGQAAGTPATALGFTNDALLERRVRRLAGADTVVGTHVTRARSSVRAGCCSPCGRRERSWRTHSRRRLHPHPPPVAVPTRSTARRSMPTRTIAVVIARQHSPIFSARRCCSRTVGFIAPTSSATRTADGRLVLTRIAIVLRGKCNVRGAALATSEVSGHGSALSACVGVCCVGASGGLRARFFWSVGR